MALDTAAVRDLLQKLDTDREAYLTTLTRAHETLAQALLSSAKEPTSSPIPVPAPAATPSTPTLSPSIPQFPSRKRAPSSHLDLESFKKGSLLSGSFISGDTSSESDDDESFFAQQTLPPQSFTEDDLRAHLRLHQWDEHGQIILGDLLSATWVLKNDELFRARMEASLEISDPFAHHTVYEVGGDGSALLHRASSEDATEALWQSLSNTNADPSRQRQAVGRIVILREPSSLLFGALHLTMNEHFDMDAIYKLLIDDSPTKAYMQSSFQEDSRQQRSFVFCFKYHTIVGDGRRPMRFQKSDRDLRSTLSHIPIASCSSVVALSFTGEPIRTLKSRSRRKKQFVGRVFDPFASYRVCAVQCFPDWKSSVDYHEANKHYVNGPEAFLVTLLHEFRDAQKRFLEINKRIVALATPPSDFMFNRELRDNLLFEDQTYTYSRRYFWTYQTLAIMSDNIQAMITAYKDTFTDDVWTGKHKFIWPGTEETSSRYSNFRKKMKQLRREFEHEIKQLEHVVQLNQQEQKDIKSLRDQLFSGTSVQESRKSVEQTSITVQQGHNIKLLTLVSIFFLPLTFVTSVFGMTNMPPEDNFVPFGIVIVIICVPTYLLIGSLNTTRGMKFWRKRTMDLFRLIGKILMYVFTFFRPHSEKSKKLRDQFAEPKEEKASLSSPGSNMPRTQSALEGIAARRASEANVLSHGKMADSPAHLGDPARTSTIKFDESTMFDKQPEGPQRATTLDPPADEDALDPVERLDRAMTNTEQYSQRLAKSPQAHSPRSIGVLRRLSDLFDRSKSRGSPV